MTKNEVKHIVNNYFKKLKKQYKSIDPDFDIEAIHHFRVAYKKVRAFFRLLSFEKENGIKIPKTLKNVYRALGTIRDMQLQQVRIKEAAKPLPKLPLGYISLLSEEIAKAKKNFLEQSSRTILDDSNKKALAELPSRFNRKNFQRFIHQKKRDTLAMISSGNFSDENLHSIRKNLKDIYYIQEIRQQTRVMGSSRTARKYQEDQTVKEFLDKMGDFQDKRTGIALLNRSWYIKLSKQNQALLNIIKQQWIKDKVNRKKSLVRNLNFPQAWINIVDGGY